MGDSSGSVSVDVERLFFGGKVRALPPLDFPPHFRLDCVHSCGEGFVLSLLRPPPWGLSLLFLG